MKLKVISLVYLALVAGLLIMAILMGSAASLAAGPPPTGTPESTKEVPCTYFQELKALPASQQVSVGQKHLDTTSVPSASAPFSVALASNSAGWQRIMIEDYEGTFPLPGWELFDLSSTDGGEYLWGQRDCKTLSGSYGLWACGGGLDGALLACGETYPNELDTLLKSIPFDLSQATDAELQFSLWGDIEGDGQILIDEFGWGAHKGELIFHGYGTAGQTGDWVPEGLNLKDVPVLGDLTGQPEVYVAWWFKSNQSNPIAYEGIFVDDAALWVYIPPSPTPTPPPPTLPITRHTTLADFVGGRSDDGTVVAAERGDGALTLAAQTDTLGNWERQPSLPKELLDFAAVTAKGHLFIIGGNSPDGGYQRRVYSASIHDDGFLGHWDEVTQLPQALAGHSAVVTDDHLFVLGGFNQNGVQATVFSARINDDGTLGPWTTLLALPEPLKQHAAVAAHGYVYVLGGSEQDVSVSDAVYRALVNADGSLSDWQTLPNSLPRATEHHAAVVTCNHLYLIGGADASVQWNSVYRAEIQANGRLGAWNLTQSLPDPLMVHAATATGGGILVTGGWHSGDPTYMPQRRVYWAALNPDCSLGGWLEAPPLPYSTNDHTLVATNRYVYNLGGANATRRYFASVLMAPLQSGSSPVPQGIFNHQFRLGRIYNIEALHWTQEGSGDSQISLRYRVAHPATGEYGPWSDYASTNPIPVNVRGGYLEYQLKFEGGSGLNDQYVSEVSLSVSALPSVYLPIVVKD